MKLWWIAFRNWRKGRRSRDGWKIAARGFREELLRLRAQNEQLQDDLRASRQNAAEIAGENEVLKRQNASLTLVIEGLDSHVRGVVATNTEIETRALGGGDDLGG